MIVRALKLPELPPQKDVSTDAPLPLPQAGRACPSTARVQRGPSEAARCASTEGEAFTASIPYLTAGKEGVHDGIFFGGIFF
mgnify:CR=1 FL=1|jgi:hypothetical protein